jgi:hypothetical protein
MTKEALEILNEEFERKEAPAPVQPNYRLMYEAWNLMGIFAVFTAAWVIMGITSAFIIFGILLYGTFHLRILEILRVKAEEQEKNESNL